MRTSKLVRGLALLGLALASAVALAQTPAFRGASQGSNSPTFRSGASASYSGSFFRAAASASSNTGTLSVSTPSGTVANDMMIAAITVQPSSVAITPPSGWTLVRRVDNTNGASHSLAVYRKVAGSSEPSSHGWGVTGATYSAGGIQSFGNVDTANPIDFEAGAATASGLVHATPSITTTVSGTTLVTAHAMTTSTTWTPGSGLSEGFDVQYQTVAQGEGLSIAGNYQLRATSGALSPRTATAAAGADYGVTHVLALRAPAPVLTVNKPTGVVQNDVMIASIGFRSKAATITPPAGWTLVRRTNSACCTSDSALAVFRKVAGASEPASYTFDINVESGPLYAAAGGILAFFNVDTTNPIDVENGQATPSSLTHATPSVNVSLINTMLVTAHTFQGASSWTPPTGMTEMFDLTGGPQTAAQTTEASYALNPGKGWTGQKIATAASNADEGVTHILALRASAPVLTLNKPTGLSTNDVMIASIGFQPASASITPPTGWTLVRRIDNTAQGASNSMATYRRVASSSEPASYTWTVNGVDYITGGIQAFYNIDTTNPIDIENGQPTPSSLSHSTPSVTTTVPNAMIVTAHALENSTTWTSPSGMTEGYDVNFGTHSIQGAYMLQAAAGATGVKTATAASNPDQGTAHILALRPGGSNQKQLYYIHVDHLNTPRQIYNANQQLAWRWDQQEPFGKTPANENPTGMGTFEFPLRFAGQYFDKETNLAYNYFRDFDPSLGRYVQSDPIGLWGGMNTYVYVGGAPLTRIDPDGRLFFIPALIGAAWGAGGGGAAWGLAGLGALGAGWWITNQVKTPNSGEPGEWVTNPGNGQERLYGPDGKPEVDIDWSHDHGAGKPHAHNWDRGRRGRGVPVSPWPQGRTPDHCPVPGK